MKTRTYTTEAGAKKAAARAYRPAILRLANDRYAWFRAGDPLPQGARAVSHGHRTLSRWSTNQWRAYDGVLLRPERHSRIRTPLQRIRTPLLEVSLIIPAYNEESRLPGTLAVYERGMREKFGENFEIVVVANGCADGTVAVAKEAAMEVPRVRVVEIEEAVGKGGAVLEGFRRARGAAVVFADADGATSPESLIMLLGALERSDIAIGSRRLKSSTITLPQTPSRRLLGFVFARTARLLFGMPFKDTQCGAKALRAEAARRLCGVVSETRWTFDLDLLLCARRLGLTISEHPVTWADNRGSRLHYASTMWEVLQAFWRMKHRQQLPLEVLP